MLEYLFNKVAGLKACSFITKRLHHWCIPVKFAEFLRAPILKKICERLLLFVVDNKNGNIWSRRYVISISCCLQQVSTEYSVFLINFSLCGICNININPFVLNAPFLYPLKTSENLTAFWCFQGIEKGCIGNEWVKRYV